MPSKTKRTNINLVDAETQRPLTREETPDYVNKYVATIGQLAKDFSDLWPFDGVPASTTMDVIKTNDEEVKKICMNIDVSKASSVSNVSSAIFKDTFLVIIPRLTYMFNQSFAEASFPTSWKQASVIPLLKGGDPSHVKNLRPVSLLPLPEEMAERIVHTRMEKYLQDNNLLKGDLYWWRVGPMRVVYIGGEWAQ